MYTRTPAETHKLNSLQKKRTMQDYFVMDRIGEGAHGLVLRARHLPSGQEVALKKVKVRRLDEGIPRSALRERNILRSIDCRYVVRLLDSFPAGPGLVLVLELMPSGLWEALHDTERPLKPDVAKTYMRMLLLGLDYLHQHGIMHRDLKPANLLIAASGHLKIADLGQARLCWRNSSTARPSASARQQGMGDRPYSHQVATRWYRAPELLYGARRYTVAIDLWAAGCILAELLTRSPLFPGETDIEQLAMVVGSLGSPTEATWPGLSSLPDFNKISFPESRGTPWEKLLPDCPPAALRLLQGMLRYDPARRTTAAEALCHGFFFSEPLPCPDRDLPRPPANHRAMFKEREMTVTRSMSDIFEPLTSLLTRSSGQLPADFYAPKTGMLTCDPCQDGHKAKGEPMPRKKISFREE